MITGYNNDIKHRGTVFHVQTEDKGETSAWIESLIYTGGRILARKRVTYKQLLDEGADKPAIGKLMERQHRLMIHQIREGRFDGETSDGVAPGSTPHAEDDAKIHTTRIQQQAEAMFGPTEDKATEEQVPEPRAEAEFVPPPAAAPDDVAAPSASTPPAEVAITPPAEAASDAAPDAEPAADAPASASDAAEAVQGREEGEAPSDPIEVPADQASTDHASADQIPTAEMPVVPTPEAEDEVSVEVGPAPTLDQVIFDYLSSVAQEESLVLLMDESPPLASATTTRMDLGTHASRSGKPIEGAAIAVRMISKTGGPVTLAEGTTDAEGTLQLVVEVPEVERDSAALIITAGSSIGNAEIKHLL